jgi:hypothetical protein
MGVCRGFSLQWGITKVIARTLQAAAAQEPGRPPLPGKGGSGAEGGQPTPPSLFNSSLGFLAVREDYAPLEASLSALPSDEAAPAASSADTAGAHASSIGRNAVAAQGNTFLQFQSWHAD